MAGATETPREARRDQNDERPAGGDRDSRAEFRETRPGMAGATETPS
jgi:hypothetical protein